MLIALIFFFVVWNVINILNHYPNQVVIFITHQMKIMRLLKTPQQQTRKGDNDRDISCL